MMTFIGAASPMAAQNSRPQAAPGLLRFLLFPCIETVAVSAVVESPALPDHFRR
jgi:hypothetical protein